MPNESPKSNSLTQSSPDVLCPPLYSHRAVDYSLRRRIVERHRRVEADEGVGEETKQNHHGRQTEGGENGAEQTRGHKDPVCPVRVPELKQNMESRTLCRI